MAGERPLLPDVDDQAVKRLSNAMARAHGRSNAWLHVGDARRLLAVLTDDDLLALAETRGYSRAALQPEGSAGTAPDRYRDELAARFWVYYRCGYVDCEIVEPHEHGGGPPMREMTPDERAAAEGSARDGG